MENHYNQDGFKISSKPSNTEFDSILVENKAQDELYDIKIERNKHKQKLKKGGSLANSPMRNQVSFVDQNIHQLN